MAMPIPSCSLEDSQAEKKTRTRKTHHKVRSGCITCKVRRKKCDETKPSCNRCTSTGRKCDGYEQILRTVSYQPLPGRQLHAAGSYAEEHQNDIETLARSNNASLESIPRQPAMQLFVSDIELQCFDYFRTVTAQQLGNYHDSSIWRNFVVRAALTHPVVLKATAALGAVHRRHDLGISKEAFQYCAIAKRLDDEATRAFNAFVKHDRTRPYAREVVMMAQMLRGVFLTFQGEFERAAACMAYGLATLWNRPLKSLGSKTYKYASKIHPHIFTELFKKLGLFAVKVLGRKHIILTDPRCGILPVVPFVFPSLQHGLDLLYTQIEHLYCIPTSIWRDTRKRQEAQTAHVQFLLRWNAALAETTSVMGERTIEQVQACFLLRRIRSTIYVVLYLVLYLQSDEKRSFVDFEGLKQDLLSGEDAGPLPLDDVFAQDDPLHCTGLEGNLFTPDGTDLRSSVSGMYADLESDLEPAIVSPALWTMVNQDEDLVTNISGITVLVDSLTSDTATFDRAPYTMSMNLDSGIGPPRSSVALPSSSAKVRHLIRNLLQPASLDKIYSELYTPQCSPSPSSTVTKKQEENVGYGRLYNIAEQVCALEEHAVFAAARETHIVPRGVLPRWLDVTCFLEEQKMLVRYCSRDSVEGVDGPHGGILWTQEWVQF